MADPDDTTMTREDMRLWLKDEVRLVTKCAELQLKEANDFVTQYLAGKLSPNEAMEKMLRYEERWGEPKLAVAMPREEIPDGEIIKRLDAERKEWLEKYRSKGRDGGRNL
jgi:hypothetical protein